MRTEPIEVSPRFRAAVALAIVRLERNAARDELALPHLTSEDHRRRHRLLIQRQIDKALRLREMLRALAMRGANAA